MDDFGLLLKLFDGLLPGMNGGGNMGGGGSGGGPVIIMSGGCGNNNSGDEGGQCPPRSPRDDVLRNPNDRSDYPGQMGGGNIHSSSSGSPRDDVLRPSRHHGNQADRNLEVFLPKVFDRFFGFPEEESDDRFSRRPDPFAPGAGGLLFGGFDPFGMRREMRGWDHGMDEAFGGGGSQSRMLYKQSSTTRDGEGNRQVRVVTRDGRGVEVERVETHTPDGRVEVREERRRLGDDDVKPLAGLKSYKDFLSKPLFKREIFSFDGKPRE